MIDFTPLANGFLFCLAFLPLGVWKAIELIIWGINKLVA